MEKIIKLNGKVDSTNAKNVEDGIKKEIGEFKGKIIFDADELTYISSAGLRVLLRLKKDYGDIKVINCSSDIYEIFSMTGFSEMMDVSKAFRNISVDGCEIIGKGANGTVYRIDSDTIVKVYRNTETFEAIERERLLARKAFIKGIPTAIPYDIVRVGDCYGAVFELLNAKMYSDLINDGENIEKLVSDSVNVLKIIHSIELDKDELPDKRLKALKWIDGCKDSLPSDVYKKLRKLVEDIPTVKTMLHGDYQIKNIMSQDGEVILIDMDSLAVGHPIFEFSRIFSTYEGYCCVDQNNPAEFLGIDAEVCRKFWQLTFKTYFNDKSEEELMGIQKKAEVLCYIALLYRFVKDNIYEHAIKFCKDYLVENVDKVDKLYY